VASLGRQDIGNVIREDPSRQEGVGGRRLKTRFYRVDRLISGKEIGKLSKS
jgi:hypothetical protein